MMTSYEILFFGLYATLMSATFFAYLYGRFLIAKKSKIPPKKRLEFYRLNRFILTLFIVSLTIFLGAYILTVENPIVSLFSAFFITINLQVLHWNLTYSAKADPLSGFAKYYNHKRRSKRIGSKIKKNIVPNEEGVNILVSIEDCLKELENSTDVEVKRLLSSSSERGVWDVTLPSEDNFPAYRITISSDLSDSSRCVSLCAPLYSIPNDFEDLEFLYRLISDFNLHSVSASIRLFNREFVLLETIFFDPLDKNFFVKVIQHFNLHYRISYRLVVGAIQGEVQA